MTASDLRAAMTFLMVRAKNGEAVEVYGVSRQVNTARAATGGSVLHVGRAETRGIGLRIVTAERTGYASTADLTDAGLTDCLDQARGNAALAHPDRTGRLPMPEKVEGLTGLCPPGLAEFSMPQRVGLAVDLARRATSLDWRVRTIDSATYRDERTTVFLASTTGMDLAHERGYTELSVDVVGDDGRSVASDSGYCTARSPLDLDITSVAMDAVERTTRLLGRRHPFEGALPMLLGPDVAAVVLAATGRAFAGAPGFGRGPFAGSDPAKLTSPCLTLHDDGLHIASPASAPFDDEGIPRRQTTLIKLGAASGALHSTATAAAGVAGQLSTGNARRGSHKSPPGVAPTTLVPLSTQQAQSLWMHAPVMVYLQQLAGGQSGINQSTGRINVGGVGFVIRNGEVAGALATVPLATTIHRLLGGLIAIGDDHSFVTGSTVFAPTLLCDAGLLARASF